MAVSKSAMEMQVVKAIAMPHCVVGFLKMNLFTFNARVGGKGDGKWFYRLISWWPYAIILTVYGVQRFRIGNNLPEAPGVFREAGLSWRE